MDYALLENQYKSLLIGRYLTDMANTSAFLFENLKDINWVGFYLLEEATLYLGPFQGNIACTTIPISKGVCGASVSQKKIMNIPDVHQFVGHIACDARSRSEIVFPLIDKVGKIFGVLDIDSPLINRFSISEEQKFLENIVNHFMDLTKF